MKVGIDELVNSIDPMDTLFRELLSELNSPTAAIPTFEGLQISKHYEGLSRKDANMDLSLITGDGITAEAGKLYRAYTAQELEDIGISQDEFLRKSFSGE